MPNRNWTLTLGGFAAAIGIAALLLAGEPWVPAADVTGVPALSCDQGQMPGTPVPGEGSNAACRIRPECDSDDDCDAICGPGLGNCIHNRCPIRICRCG
jgi:hypothetical protein